MIICNPVKFTAILTEPVTHIAFANPQTENTESFLVYNSTQVSELLKTYRKFIAKYLPTEPNVLKTVITLTDCNVFPHKTVDTITFTKTKTNKIISHSQTHYHFTYRDLKNSAFETDRPYGLSKLL